MKRLAVGTTGSHARIHPTQVRAIEVQVPGEREQYAIAKALDDIDKLISALTALITKKQAIKQGMMQELLTGRTRLPGFKGKWYLCPLGDLLSYEQPTRYLVKTTKQFDTGRIPVLTAGKTFILGYTNEPFGIYTSHPVIIFDDFTTASQYVDFDFKVKSSAMKILSARSGVDIRFVYERMQLIEFPLGDHKRYWISEYSQQEIKVPREEEQIAISHVIADADRELTLLELILAKARDVKQGMMQELLTGRTRLPVQETVA
jgi:type I restriction enzyme S subunit